MRKLLKQSESIKSLAISLSAISINDAKYTDEQNVNKNTKTLKTFPKQINTIEHEFFYIKESVRASLVSGITVIHRDQATSELWAERSDEYFQS